MKNKKRHMTHHRNKIISCLLFVTVLCTFVAPPVTVAGATKEAVISAVAEPNVVSKGDQFSVAISIENVPGNFMGAELRPSFDEDAFTLESVSPGNLWTDPDSIECDIQPGTGYINTIDWESGTNYSGEDGKTLAILTYKVKNTAKNRIYNDINYSWVMWDMDGNENNMGGMASVSVTVAGGSGDPTSHSVTFTSSNAAVTIGGKAVTGADIVENSDLTFSINPDQGFEIQSVSASNGTMKDNGGGSYTLSEVTADTTVIVTTRLMPLLDVFFNTGDFASVKVSGITTSSAVVNKDGELNFSVTTTDGLEVISVSANNGKIKDNGGGSYTLSEATGAVIVTVNMGETQKEADFTIYSAEDLYTFAKSVNSGKSFDGKLIRLGTDIDLANKSWIPIGTANSAASTAAVNFSGVFDGDGYTIKGLNVSGNRGGIGLFGSIRGAIVKNLTIYGKVSGGNVWSKTEDVDDYANTGAFAGQGSGTFINCVNHAEVNGLAGYTAGILGRNIENSVSIYNCINYGSVTASASYDDDGIRLAQAGNAAGIANCVSGKIKNCANFGSVKGGTRDRHVAGIVNGDVANGSLTIDSCYNLGSIVSMAAYTGGILSGNASSKSVLSNCYNLGLVTSGAESQLGSSNDSVVGGIAGHFNGMVSNCYNAGNVTHTNKIPGMVGQILAKHGANASIANCYAATDPFSAAKLGSAYAEDTNGSNAGKPVLAWSLAQPDYRVVFDLQDDINLRNGDGEAVLAQSDGSYKLHIGRYRYIADKASGSFNVVAGNKIIKLSADISFNGLPTGAAVTVADGDNKVVSDNGTVGQYTSLPNGKYTYKTSASGYKIETGSFLVAGVKRSFDIKLDKINNLKFTVSPLSSDLSVTDSDGNTVLPETDNIYLLTEGKTYYYTVCAEGYVNKSNTLKADSDKTIGVTLTKGSAKVAFSVTPAAATVQVFDADNDIVQKDSDGMYFLAAGENYHYQISAENYLTSEGDFKAKDGQILSVALKEASGIIVFQIMPTEANIGLKDKAGNLVSPTSGKTYYLDQGQTYSYTVSAEGYVSQTGEVTAASGSKVINIALLHKTAQVTFKIMPANASIKLFESDSGSIQDPSSSGSGFYTFTLNEATTYEYTVKADGYDDKTDKFTVPPGGGSIGVNLTKTVLAPGGTVKGSDEIKQGGTYDIKPNTTGVITISTSDSVTLIGKGTDRSNRYKDLTIKYTVPRANLTINRLFISNNEGQTNSSTVGPGVSCIEFTGSGNTLSFSDRNLLENLGYVVSSAIHVGPNTSLTITGKDGDELYIYKYSQGAGIGGDSNESNGNITIAGGNLYIKGSKTGPLIGNDVVNGSSSNVKGSISITGGNVNLINKAKGAAIGGSSMGPGGDVSISGGNVTIISDFKGSAIGGGAENSNNGTLRITGGSLKAVRTNNSLKGDGNSRTQTVDDSLITAKKDTYQCVFDTSKLSNKNGPFSVNVDGASFYSGGLHSYRYSESTSSTISNWSEDSSDKNLYLYLKDRNHALNVNGEKFNAVWNKDTESFAITAVGAEAGLSEVIAKAPPIEVTARMQGDAGEANVEEKAVNTAIKEALAAAEKANAAAAVEIKVSVPASCTRLDINIPTAALTAMQNSKVKYLMFNTLLGNVVLDNTAVGGVVSQASEKQTTVSISKVPLASLKPEQQKAVGSGTVIDLAISSGKKVISDLGGGSAIVSVPYTLKTGESEEGISVWYLSEEGILTQVQGVKYDKTAGMATFTLKHFSRYVIGYDPAAAWKNPFADVSKTDWYYSNVYYVYTKGLFQGVSTTSFAPKSPMNRAMLVTALWRLEGKATPGAISTFKDVKEGSWYADAVSWAAEKGIVSGYSDKTFRPEAQISREQIAAILYRYAVSKGYKFDSKGDLSTYKDRSSVSSWAVEAISSINAKGIIGGRTAETLEPDSLATRAEVAAILQRFNGAIPLQ